MLKKFLQLRNLCNSHKNLWITKKVASQSKTKSNAPEKRWNKFMASFQPLSQLIDSSFFPACVHRKAKNLPHSRAKNGFNDSSGFMSQCEKILPRWILLSYRLFDEKQTKANSKADTSVFSLRYLFCKRTRLFYWLCLFQFMWPYVN